MLWNSKKTTQLLETFGNNDYLKSPDFTKHTPFTFKLSSGLITYHIDLTGEQN